MIIEKNKFGIYTKPIITTETEEIDDIMLYLEHFKLDLEYNSLGMGEATASEVSFTIPQCRMIVTPPEDGCIFRFTNNMELPGGLEVQEKPSKVVQDADNRYWLYYGVNTIGLTVDTSEHLNAIRWDEEKQEYSEEMFNF